MLLPCNSCLLLDLIGINVKPELPLCKKHRETDLITPSVLLPHLVLVLLAHLTELPAELHVDLEVEVALVALVGLHAEVAAQLFAL